MRLRLATAAERLLDAVMKVISVPFGVVAAARRCQHCSTDGSTVLMLAVERNYTEIADLLIRAQANVNAQTNMVQPPSLSPARTDMSR